MIIKNKRFSQIRIEKILSKTLTDDQRFTQIKISAYK